MGGRIKGLLLVAFAALLMRACVVEPVRLTDDSMAPTLVDGDVAFVFKLRYGLRVPGSGAMLWEWAQPQKGDIVVAAAMGDPPVNLMRRVSAVPGEQVSLSWTEKALAEPAAPPGTVALKPDEYFLLAEKNEGVMDSRRMGPVPRRAILGKVTYTWFAKNPSNEGGSKVESEKSRILQPVQ